MQGFGTATYAPHLMSPPPSMQCAPGTFPLHNQYGGDGRMASYPMPYNWPPQMSHQYPQPNNEALVTAVTQAVITALPAMMMSVEKRIIQAVQNFIPQPPDAGSSLKLEPTVPKSIAEPSQNEALRKAFGRRPISLVAGSGSTVKQRPDRVCKLNENIKNIIVNEYLFRHILFSQIAFTARAYLIPKLICT